MKNKKYMPNKQNHGHVPIPIDGRALTVTTDCGNCEECRKKLQNKYYQRLSNELKINTGKLATFTFTDESIRYIYSKLIKIEKRTQIPDSNEILSYAHKKFSDRYKKKYKIRPRGFYISELGSSKIKKRKDGSTVKGTERIHIHAILLFDKPNEEIQKLWKYGNVDFGTYCNEQTINYVLKYVTKIDEEHLGYKPIIRASSNLGKNYLKTWNAQQNRYKTEGETNTTYKNPSGNRTGLNTTFKRTLYTDAQREDIWMKNLDKGVRYINGIEYPYKTENNKENFNKALEYQRKKNINKGYGDRSNKYKKQFYPAANNMAEIIKNLNK